MVSGADPGFDQGGGAPDRDRPKTAILGPQFCRILVLGPHFWWSGGGGPGPRAPPPWIRPWVYVMVIQRPAVDYTKIFFRGALALRETIVYSTAAS